MIFCFKLEDKEFKEQNYDTDYDDLRTKYQNEYDRANPLTKELALIEYFKFIKSSISHKTKAKPQTTNLCYCCSRIYCFRSSRT